MNNKDWNIKSTEIIRQCYHIAWSRGILQRTKTQDSQKLRVTFIEGWSGQWQKVKDIKESLSKNKQIADCWAN